MASYRDDRVSDSDSDHTAEYNTEEEELQPGPSKKSKSAKALPQNCTRNDLNRPEIQNFPGGGACPQTPLAAREPIAFCFNVTHAKFANLAGMVWEGLMILKVMIPLILRVFC